MRRIACWGAIGLCVAAVLLSSATAASLSSARERLTKAGLGGSLEPFVEGHAASHLSVASEVAEVAVPLTVLEKWYAQQWQHTPTASVVGGTHAGYPVIDDGIVGPIPFAPILFSPHPQLDIVSKHMGSAGRVARDQARTSALDNRWNACYALCNTLPGSPLRPIRFELCLGVYCADPIPAIVKRIEHVRRSQALRNTVYAPPKPGCTRAKPSTAWSFVQHALKHMRANGVMSPLGLSFKAFAHTVELDISTKRLEAGTWNGGGGHFIAELAAHLADDRWSAPTTLPNVINRVTTLQMGVAAIAAPVLRSLTEPPDVRSGYYDPGLCLAGNVAASRVGEGCRNALRMWNHANLVQVNWDAQNPGWQLAAGPHRYVVRALRRAKNGVLYLTFLKTRRSDFLHRYVAQSGRKTLFPEAFTPEQLLLLGDLARERVMHLWQQAPPAAYPALAPGVGVPPKAGHVLTKQDWDTPPHSAWVGSLRQSGRNYLFKLTIENEAILGGVTNGMPLHVEGYWEEPEWLPASGRRTFLADPSIDLVTGLAVDPVALRGAEEQEWLHGIVGGAPADATRTAPARMEALMLADVVSASYGLRATIYPNADNFNSAHGVFVAPYANGCSDVLPDITDSRATALMPDVAAKFPMQPPRLTSWVTHENLKKAVQNSDTDRFEYASIAKPLLPS